MHPSFLRLACRCRRLTSTVADHSADTASLPTGLVDFLRLAAQRRFMTGQLAEGIFCLGQIAAAGGGEPGPLEWGALQHLLTVKMQNAELSRAAAERQSKSSAPSTAVTTYLTMKSQLLRGDLKGAVQGIVAARAAGIEVSTKTFGVLVHGLATGGAVAEAVALLRGLPPDSISHVTVGSVMVALIRADKPSAAIRLFDSLCKGVGDTPPLVAPSVECFNNCIEAWTLEMQLLRRRSTRDRERVRALESHGAEAALAEPPDRSAASFLGQVFDSMKAQGVSPNSATFDQVRSAGCVHSME
jgi:hypothetical protein